MVKYQLNFSFVILCNVAVNGFMYGNLPGLEMNKGSKVRWHLMGLGTEMDMHGIYFQGNTFQRQGTNRDTLGLFPHTTVTVSMQPDLSGQYIFLSIHPQKHISNSLLCTFYIFPVIVGVFEVSCLVSDHYVGGMRQLYRVMGSEDKDFSVLESQIVEYFICAEEVEWDYSPDRTWELQNFNTTEENRSVNIQQLLLLLQYLNGICNQILVSVLAVCLWGRERTD